MADNLDSEVSSKMSNLNVNATEFVPSWLPPAATAETPASTKTGQIFDMESIGMWFLILLYFLDETSSMQVDSAESKAPVADSWEDNADNSTASLPNTGEAVSTPEEEDVSMETDDSVSRSKPKSKPRAKDEEATTTQKEHVNVVFIGHVGKDI